MNHADLTNSIDANSIRKEWHEEEWYYSAVDFISEFLKIDRRRARNYYHVLKKRLLQNGEPLPQICKIKARATDGKMYLTDFIGSSSVQMLQTYLEPRLRNRHYRMEIRQDDEVTFFHPRVQSHLEQLGWQIEHHVSLPSGSIIDIIAKSQATTYVIECKPRLHNNNLYQAIGQVLCYRYEFDVQSIPAIASYSSAITDYVRQSCASLGIYLIELNLD
jgi:hypothetical protein